MNEKIGCEFGSAAVEFLKSNVAAGKLEEHLKNCADCRETLRVARFFQSNLAQEPAPRRLPAAGLIFWKARLREKQRAAEQVNQPILVAQVVGAIIFVILLIWLLPLSSIGEAFIKTTELTAYLVFPLLLVFALVSIVVFAAMRRLLPDK